MWDPRCGPHRYHRLRRCVQNSSRSRWWGRRPGEACLRLAYGVVALGTLIRACLLFAVAAPFGRDGYYYVLQVEHLRHAALAIPTTSVVPIALMTLASTIIGPVAGIKLVALGASAALSLGVIRVVWEYSGRGELALAAGVLATCAALHNMLVVEYVNNLGAMAFFVWALVWLERLARVGLNRAIVPLCMMVAGAALSHPSAAAALSIVLLFRVLSRPGLRLSTTALLIICVGVTLTAVRLRSSLEISWASAPLVGLWSHPSGAYSVLLLVAAGGHLLSRYRQRASALAAARHVPILACLLVVSIAFVANPAFGYGSAFRTAPDRLALWGWLLSAICAPLLCIEIDGRYSPRSLVFGAALLGCTLLAGATQGLPAGADPTFLLEREHLVSAIRQLPPNALAGMTVIAEHGNQFAVSLITGAGARAASSERADQVVWLLKAAGDRTQWPADSIVAGDYAFVRGSQLDAWLDEGLQLSE